MRVRLLGVGDAARYLGIGETKLRELRLPRKVFGCRKLYDVADLDDWADSLPYENGKNEDEEFADAAFSQG